MIFQKLAEQPAIGVGPERSEGRKKLAKKKISSLRLRSRSDLQQFFSKAF